MPVIPPGQAIAYDTVYNVLSTARTRLNDTLPTLWPVGGKLLENSQVQTQQMFNTAWRRLQEFLANLGYTRLTQEAVIYQVPAVYGSDPAIQTYINWFNFFDGANLYDQPVLPPDLIIPKRIWERQTGNASGFAEMGMMLDGLPTWNKQARNLCWEWRADGIYMPGSQASMDLRIRYAAYLPDFNDIGTSPWFQQPVPIMRCLDSLSFYVCAEVFEARGTEDANPFMAKAEAAAKLIMNRDVSLNQRVNVRRRPRSGRFESSGYGGGLWC